LRGSLDTWSRGL